jgi:hypothetical protein
MTTAEWHEPLIETWETFQGRGTYDSDSSEDETCNNIPAIDPVDQINTFGKYVCGTKSDFNFINAHRPSSLNECAQDEIKCSEATTAETTICVPEGS